MAWENQTPDVTPPFSASIALLVVAAQIDREVQSALQTVGLSRRKLGVLGHLGRSPGLSFTELARRAGVTVQSMHTLIGTLDRDGLVASGAGQRGRAATIALTDIGRQQLRNGISAVAEIDESAFGEASSPARQQLRDALAALATEMRDA